MLTKLNFGILLPNSFRNHRPAYSSDSWLPSLLGWERLVLGSWMLAMLVVTQSYTGNLMSLLAVRYIPMPLQTLRALLDDIATTMVWEYDTAYVNYFRVSSFLKE